MSLCCLIPAKKISIKNNATIFHNTISIIDEYVSNSEILLDDITEHKLSEEKTEQLETKNKKLKYNIFQNYEALGFVEDDKFKSGYYPKKLNEDFFDKYVELYSFDELIHGVYEFSSCYFTVDYVDVGNVLEQKFYDHFSDRFISTSNYKLNCDGYYKEHPEADPKPSSGNVTDGGNFNNAADGNSVYYSSSSFTDYSEVSYYGDFAICEKLEHGYDEGRYEWSNGTFYDEPAHYTSSTTYTLYYKGIRIESVNSNELPDIQFYISEDKSMYYQVEPNLSKDGIVIIEKDLKSKS